MSNEKIEQAARAAYVEMEWARRITEHDSDRRTDAEYKERAGKHWDDGHAGYSMYRRYRRQAAAVIAAIHPAVTTAEELDASNRVIALGEDQMERDKARLDKVRALVINRRIPYTRSAAVLVISEVAKALDGSDQ